MMVNSYIGGPEIWVIAGVIILLFGAKKVPEMMRGVGEGMREFKKVSKEQDDSSKDDTTTAENK